MLEIPKLNHSLPANCNILIVDSNIVHKKIAIKVISDIKIIFPLAKLYFASASMDLSVKILDNVKKIFYGAMSNEARTISQKEASSKGITNDINIFPWENIHEEWEAISSQNAKT